MSTPTVRSPVDVAPVTPPLSLSGRVRNSATGYPLAGVLVQAYYVQPPQVAWRDFPRRRVIGSAHADTAGSWNIVWDAGPAVSQLVCLLANCSVGEVRSERDRSRRALSLLLVTAASDGRTRFDRARFGGANCHQTFDENAVARPGQPRGEGGAGHAQHYSRPVGSDRLRDTHLSRLVALTAAKRIICSGGCISRSTRHADRYRAGSVMADTRGARRIGCVSQGAGDRGAPKGGDDGAHRIGAKTRRLSRARGGQLVDRSETVRTRPRRRDQRQPGSISVALPRGHGPGRSLLHPSLAIVIICAHNGPA